MSQVNDYTLAYVFYIVISIKIYMSDDLNIHKPNGYYSAANVCRCMSIKFQSFLEFKPFFHKMLMATQLFIDDYICGYVLVEVVPNLNILI